MDNIVLFTSKIFLLKMQKKKNYRSQGRCSKELKDVQ